MLASQQAGNNAGDFFADEVVAATLIHEIGDGIVTGLMWSPDGTRAVGRGTGGMWLFDNLDDLTQSTGRLAGPGNLTVMAFSPDGRFFAGVDGSTVGYIPTIALYDGMTGELVRELATADSYNTRTFVGVAFHASGETILGITNTGQLVEFHIESGEMMRAREGTLSAPGRLIISPDGAWLLHMSSYRASPNDSRGVAVLMNYESLQATALRGHTGTLAGAVFLPDGRLVTTDSDQVLKVWDIPALLESGEPTLTLNLERRLQNLTVLDDGTLLAMDSPNFIIDLEAGEATQYNLRGVVSPDGQWTIRAVDGEILLRHETREFATRIAALPYYSGPIASPVADRVALSTGYQQPVSLIDVTTGEFVGQIEIADTHGSWAFNADGSVLARYNVRESLISLINVADGEVMQTLAHDNDAGSPPSVFQFSQDGGRLMGYRKSILSSNETNSAYVWDVDSGERLAIINEVESATAMDAAITPDGSAVITLVQTNDENTRVTTLNVWDVESGEQTRSVTLSAGVAGYHLTLSPDGEVLVVSGLLSDVFMSGLQFFDVQTLEPTSEFMTLYNVNASKATFSTDGSRLMLGSSGGDTYIMDVASQLVVARIIPVAEVFAEHHFVYGANDRVVTTDPSGIIRVWQIEQAQ